MRYVAPHETKLMFTCPTKRSRQNWLGISDSIISLAFQKPAVGRPFLEAFDPVAGRFGVVRPQTKAVADPGVEVQFRGHFELLELGIHTGQTFRDVGPVVGKTSGALHGFTSGLRVLSFGNAEKSRSAVQSSRTPWCRQSAAMRASCMRRPQSLARTARSRSCSK